LPPEEADAAAAATAIPLNMLILSRDSLERLYYEVYQGRHFPKMRIIEYVGYVIRLTQKYRSVEK
jgi:hypothetical protein